MAADARYGCGRTVFVDVVLGEPRSELHRRPSYLAGSPTKLEPGAELRTEPNILVNATYDRMFARKLVEHFASNESGVGHAERLKIASKSGGGKQEKARGEDVESGAAQNGVSQRRTTEACS
jgi:hypothetical protein